MEGDEKKEIDKS